MEFDSKCVFFYVMPENGREPQFRFLFLGSARSRSDWMGLSAGCWTVGHFWFKKLGECNRNYIFYRIERMEGVVSLFSVEWVGHQKKKKDLKR